MAGNVKRGFGTYLLILLLMLVAAFLITCVVMIFQPFKEVLGYQYFTYNDALPYEYNFTDNKSVAFDFKSKDIIKINSNYANIRIEKNTKVDDVAVKITNKCKGFATANQNTDFEYKITSKVENSKNILEISVVEAEGVVFFQKDVEIAVLVPYYDCANNAETLAEQQIIITTKSGNVFIGNQNEINQTKDGAECSFPNLVVSDLSIQTTSGKVYLYPYLNPYFLSLNIKTDSGNIKSFLNNFGVDSLSLKTQSGNIEANEISNNVTSTNNVSEIFIENGSLNIQTFNGNIDLSMKNGSLNIQSVKGNIIANNSAKHFGKAKLIVNTVEGDVSLPFLGASNVNFDKITGQAYMEGEGCNINIAKIENVSYLKTTSGNIYVYTTADDVTAESTTGDIEVYFANKNIKNSLNFASTKGKIKLNILPTLEFKMQVKDLEGNFKTKGVSVETFDSFNNPLVVNGGTKEINFITNGKVQVALFNIEETD